MVDIQRLRVFRAVIASGSVQAAATHLGFTPSAVSQQLSALQRETGLTLFERSGRGLMPTYAGRELAGRSEETMAALARLDRVVDGLRAGRVGQLSIACFPSAGERWIPRLASRLRREHPDITLTVDLTETATERAANGAARGSDLVVCTEDPDDPGVALAGYRRRELTVEPFLVVLPEGHPLLDEVVEGALRFAQVAGHDWVDEYGTEQTCGRIVRRAARMAGVTPRVVARCQDHHTSMALVAAGVGVTLAPRLTLGALPPAARALPLVDPEPRRRIVVHAREQADAVVERAVAVLREIVADTSSAQSSGDQPRRSHSQSQSTRE